MLRRTWHWARAYASAHMISAILLALLCFPDINRLAFAAVVLNGKGYDIGNAELLHPTGVAVDSLGNFYAVDSSKHRVVKFGDDGAPRRIFGSQGQGNGQLYYPQGIAAGTHSSGQTYVYVADSANSRIAVFNAGGQYKGQFPDSAPGGLNHPAAIAFLKNPNSDGGLVIVGDHRNNRVVLFNDSGLYLASFQCSSCPAGGIRPTGVSARWNNGSALIYVADEITGLVQVINAAGNWVRSYGKGQLHAADDVAVDEEGNLYVADAAFGYERVQKFAPGGKLLFTLNTTGSTYFISPHGISLDEQGRIYVAVTGLSDVYRFKEVPSALTVGPRAGKAYWIDTKGIWFDVYYNGLEQTCRAGGSAVVKAPAGSSQPFTIDGGPVTIGKNNSEPLKMDMTTPQTNLVDRTWDQGKKIAVNAKFNARCQDGILLQKTLSFQR